MTTRYGPWTVGDVRRLRAETRRISVHRGLLYGPFGLCYATGLLAGETHSVNARGEVLPWSLFVQGSGLFVASVRDPWVALGLCDDMLALDRAYWGARPPADRRRAVAPIVAKWASEGDATMSDAIREAAIAVAAETPGWGGS